MNFTNEMLEKAKAAKSAAELLTMAKENNIEITEAQAIEYYAKLNGENKELADEELEQAAGGASPSTSSDHGTCEYCGKYYSELGEHIYLFHPERFSEWASKNYSSGC